MKKISQISSLVIYFLDKISLLLTEL